MPEYKVGECLVCGKVLYNYDIECPDCGSFAHYEHDY